MAFFSWLNSLFTRDSKGASSSRTPRRGGDAPWFLMGGGDLSVATVYCCVRFLSESVASLPLRYLKHRAGGIFTDAGDSHMDYLLNTQPDYALSAYDHWRTVIQQVLMRGNAYIIPFYRGGSLELDRLALCGVGTVNHDMRNDTYFVSDVENGIFGTFREDNVIHIKGMPGPNPKTGLSVLSYARRCLDIAKAGDAETLNRFTTGGNVRGLVSNDKGLKGYGKYQDRELEKAAESIDDRFRGGERIVSLPGDVDFKQISLTSADMQFLESRKFSVLDICRFFGVHPSFVFSDTATNYKSAEQANMAFLTHTLSPLLRNIENELRRKLLAPSMCGKYDFRFDPRSLHACDLSGMADYRSKLLQTGFTINEVRRMDDMPPVTGGDTVMVSANLKSLDEILYYQLPDTDPQGTGAKKVKDDDKGE